MAKFGSFIKIIKMQKIKICGIKSSKEARSIINLNIDYLGVIFAQSKRKVSVDIACEISNLAHTNAKKCVGIFADIDENEILQICKTVNLDIVQIYGEILPNLYEGLHAKNIEIWRVFNISNEFPNLNDKFYDMALFDSKGEKLGGNGTSFDWSILKDLKPYSFGLAGGIGLENVCEAAKYKPRVIDINSKVEDENGIKNPQKISQILEKLRF